MEKQLHRTGLQQQPAHGCAHKPAAAPCAQKTLPSPPGRDPQALADPSTATTAATETQSPDLPPEEERRQKKIKPGEREKTEGEQI
jgi:hypothetical protein